MDDLRKCALPQKKHAFFKISKCAGKIKQLKQVGTRYNSGIKQDDFIARADIVIDRSYYDKRREEKG